MRSALAGLMRRHPMVFLTPTYDVDLIWHTHMAYPRQYHLDCLSLVGRVVGHDDTDTDRGEGSKLWKVSGLLIN